MHLSFALPLWLRKHHVEPSVTRPAVIVCTMVAVQATLPAFGKLLTGALSPLSLLFVSELMGGLFAATSFGLLPMLKAFRSLKNQERNALFLFGVLTGILSPLLWFMGLSMTSSVNAQILSRADLPILFALSVGILGEASTRRHWCAMGALLVGFILVSLHVDTAEFRFGMGDVLVLLSATGYAVGIFTVKRSIAHLPPELLIGSRSIAALAIFFAVSPFQEQTFVQALVALPMNMIWVVLAYGFLGKFLAIYTFYMAVEELPSRSVIAWDSFSMVAGMAVSVVALHEGIGVEQVAGALLVLLGVLGLQHAPSEARTAVTRSLHVQRHRHRG